jgi:hypothetical protein
MGSSYAATFTANASLGESGGCADDSKCEIVLDNGTCTFLTAVLEVNWPLTLQEIFLLASVNCLRLLSVIARQYDPTFWMTGAGNKLGASKPTTQSRHAHIEDCLCRRV